MMLSVTFVISCLLIIYLYFYVLLILIPLFARMTFGSKARNRDLRYSDMKSESIIIHVKKFMYLIRITNILHHDITLYVFKSQQSNLKTFVYFSVKSLRLLFFCAKIPLTLHKKSPAI